VYQESENSVSAFTVASQTPDLEGKILLLIFLGTQRIKLEIQCLFTFCNQLDKTILHLTYRLEHNVTTCRTASK